MNRIATFITLLAALLLTACGKEQHFTVKGNIQGLGVQVVSMSYYADDGIKHISQAATDGQFVFQGKSPTPTMCIIEVSGGQELATVVAADGDEISIEGMLSNTLAMKVKGNSTSTKIAEWTAANASTLKSGNAGAINRLIADFVSDNRKDMAATALMVTRFYAPGHETLADSLMSLIEPAARPTAVVQNFNAVLASQLTKKQSGEVRPMILYLRTDTMTHFNPFAHTLTLLAFRGDSRPKTDSVASLLQELSSRYPTRRLKIVELSTARDSTRWKQSTARDSARWDQAWVPGTVAVTEVNRLAIPRIPFFIVADSTGVQLYRGSSTQIARHCIESHFSHKGKTSTSTH